MAVVQTRWCAALRGTYGVLDGQPESHGDRAAPERVRSFGLWRVAFPCH
jgi:hypothetical protein